MCLPTMSTPTKPLPMASRPRPHAASMSSTQIPDLSSPSANSSSSSSSSWTLQTPQSPSIMAVLDSEKRGRAGSCASAETDEEEPFERTLEIRQSRNPSFGALEEQAKPTSPITRGGTPTQTPIRQGSFDSAASVQRQFNANRQVHGPDHSSGAAEIRSNIPHPISHDLRDHVPTTQNGLPVKRAIPTSPAGRAPSDSSGSSNSSHGRRMRPRLRTILSGPLTSNRSSSNTTLAKIADAISFRKLTTEDQSRSSGLDLAVSHQTQQQFLVDSGQHGHVRTKISTGSEAKFRSTSTNDEQDTIWVQRKAYPCSSTPSPTSPTSAQRPLPPTLRRGMTLPTPALPQLSDTVALKVVSPRSDHFDRMLPREIKVMIMTKLLEIGAEEERDRRWSGEVGARRELIKLSRVSRSWRALCFDGQLWANFDLSPFAARLHPRTFQQIYIHAAPFITTLSFRGMDALTSSDLLSALNSLGTDGASYGVFSKLTTIDLQGCKNLTSRPIIAVIRSAPHLRIVNLKGVPGVNSDVLHCLFTISTSLESLDVSRCRGITYSNTYHVLDSIHQTNRDKLQVLRFGGLGGTPYTPVLHELLSLIFAQFPSLHTLDLQGCTTMQSSAFITACAKLREKSQVSSIRHLILSGVTHLKADIFPAMTGLFPEVRFLELASISSLFEGNNRQDKIGFNGFLSSLPLLERLDVDGSCSAGGLDDSTLKVLARASQLTHLNIAHTGMVTPEAMVQFVRDTPTLKVFEADNTHANGAVVQEFQRCHPLDGRLSLIDCRAITAVDYLRVGGTSRPRHGFTGYSAVPMKYGTLDLHEMTVIKTFWSWRRIAIPRGWRETLKEKERELAQLSCNATAGEGSGGQKVVAKAGRGKGWRKKDDQYDAQGLCVVQ